MENDQRDGSGEDGRLEHLARMNERRGSGADRNYRMGDWPMSSVEVESEEVLAGLVAHDASSKMNGLPRFANRRVDFEAPSPVLDEGLSDKRRAKVGSIPIA